MNCDRFQQELALVPIVRAKADVAPDVEQHVEECASCAKALEERIRLDLLLDRDEPIEATSGLRDAVLSRIDAATPSIDRKTPRRLRRIQWLVPLAAAALITLYVTVYRSAPPNSTDPTAEARPDAEMLAQIDLFLDWELLDEHAADLDLITADELLTVVESAQEG